MVTTFAQVLAGLDDKQILDRFAELFPDPGPAYQKVLDTLRGMTPQPSACRLVLQWVTDIDKPPWVTVFGIENHAPVAIEYEPWAQWLGMPIGTDTLADFPAVDIAAHALWEMTYAGFDEAAIAEQAERI